MVNANPRPIAARQIATRTHLGTEALPAAAGRSFSRGADVCDGSKRINRDAVARASVKASGHSGICEMLWVSRSMVADFGMPTHFAASAQGSLPNRASTERIVSGEPFSS